ncbi:unnamed protein product [Gulo gulo]|uniref:Uncharacterized protein n=1 Tax=Gulo gulo TaxID=48420 RepID=A0A9X9M741_GULGU|nr:unnamed protein product [Gulo gulo]
MPRPAALLSSLTLLNTTHKHGHLSKETPQPKAQVSSLFGDSRGGEEAPAQRLTFSLLLGDHWRWLRKGLAYLTIGSRVGGCWRAKEKRQEGETATVTWRDRVRGRKKERNFSVEQ